MVTELWVLTATGAFSSDIPQSLAANLYLGSQNLFDVPKWYRSLSPCPVCWATFSHTPGVKKVFFVLFLHVTGGHGLVHL